jgi:hypothetical protein
MTEGAADTAKRVERLLELLDLELKKFFTVRGERSPFEP